MIATPILTDHGLSLGVAGFQVIFGMLLLIAGLRWRGRSGSMNGPIGALWMVTGLAMLVRDVVPEKVLLPVLAVAAALGIAWSVREWRADRARTAVMLRQRR